MSDKNNSSEPSMEQILESIAEIIADDSDDLGQTEPLVPQAVPVMHNAAHNATMMPNITASEQAAPAFLQSLPALSVQPVSDQGTGSLADRLANMGQNTVDENPEIPMRPVPENVALTPPGFMGQADGVEPVPVNMPVPSMAGQQPSMGTGQAFPVESAEDFLANNAQRASISAETQPVMSQMQEMPQQMVTPSVQAPIDETSEFAINPALMAQVTPEPMNEQPMSQQPMSQEPIAQVSEVAPQVLAEQPPVPQPLVPELSTSSNEVLNSFQQAEEQAALAAVNEVVAPSVVVPTTPDMNLLDASYIPPVTQATLSAEPVLNAEPVIAQPEPQVQAQADVATPPSAPVEVSAPQEPAVEPEEQSAPNLEEPVVGGADLNGAIQAMVQPMVKEWLDENLSKVVEDVVRRELATALTQK